jgi:hypothetical protein
MSAEPSRAPGFWRAVKRLAVRAIREPLLQFLAIAAVLFTANSLIHGPDQRVPGDRISISPGRVQQIADSYRLLSGRAPSRTELQALVDDFVDEEIDYREAIAMGLDADDTIVRRRMRQKLEFLVEDAQGIAEPSDADLSAWLRTHADQYRVPERISFRQVLASSDTRGAGDARAEATAFLGKLRSGVDPSTLGDASMLPAALPLTTAEGVAALFGDAFAETLFKQTSDGWLGPVTSPFGAHNVLILSREVARAPALNEVRDKLRSDWIEAKRRAARETFQARLRERYAVEIEWPEPYASQQVAQEVPRLKRPLDTLVGE